MSEKNGGPAFPCMEQAWLVDQSGNSPPVSVPSQCNGMSLRDYFAAKAMEGVVFELTRSINRATFSEGWDDKIAQQSYRVADAMLRAREVKP